MMANPPFPSQGFMENYEDKGDMADKRMKQLGVNVNLNHGVFSASARAGYNMSSDSSSSSSSSEYSYLLEERVFEVTPNKGVVAIYVSSSQV